MNQIKIGKFIAERRREQGMTQMQLAERLNITDRAVSKWETGKSLPDASIMLELCEHLGITVNDLLCGEVVQVENYNKEMEKNLLDIIKEKEAADRRLLRVEIIMGVVSIVILLALCVVAAYVPMADGWRIALIVLALVQELVFCFCGVHIEQRAGYYVCAHCGHKYVPSYKSVLWSMHMGRTRYMKCPKCDKRSWQKKVISKE